MLRMPFACLIIESEPKQHIEVLGDANLICKKRISRERQIVS